MVTFPVVYLFRGLRYLAKFGPAVLRQLAWFNSLDYYGQTHK